MSTRKAAKFKFVDLFAGIGGFHHALAQLGGECVLASELDATCRKVYSETWPDLAESALIGDIRSLTNRPDGTARELSEIAKLVPDHDVLCAGFPCQPFSKSGLQQGVLDKTRGTLFFDIMEIAKAKTPRYIILENVRNLAGPRHADTFATIIASLRECGYRVDSDPIILSPHRLAPAEGGSPQHRERVFILAEYGADVAADGELGIAGVRHDPESAWDPRDWTLDSVLLKDDEIVDIDNYRLSPEDRAAVDAWQAFVQGLPDDHLPGFPIWVDSFRVEPRYLVDAPSWKRDFIKKNSDFYRQHRKFIDAWLKVSWMPGRTFQVKDFIPSRRKFEWQARAFQKTQQERDLWKLAIHFRPSGVRVKAPNYLPTLVAITQTPYIGPRERYLTPVEAGRLQGFPDWVFPNAKVEPKSAYKQVGNAVNVGVVMHVARALFEETRAPWLGAQDRRPATQSSHERMARVDAASRSR